MFPQRPDQQGQPGGNYLVVAAIVIGVAAGIALASVTRQAGFMLGGLLAGAAVANWLARSQS